MTDETHLVGVTREGKHAQEMAAMCNAGWDPESTGGHRLGRRFETVVGRGEVVFSVLVEEYIQCFRKVLVNPRRQNALLVCMQPAVELAFSTISLVSDGRCEFAPSPR